MRGGLQNAGAYDRGRFMISNETKARVIRPVQVLSIVFFSFAALYCVAADDIVRVTGYGASKCEAVREAIVSAIDQHDGTVVASVIRSEMASRHIVESSTDYGRISTSKLNDAIASEMLKLTTGKISGYSVLDEMFDVDENCYRVELEVRFPAKYDPPGRDPDALRRMVVTTFNVRNRSFRWRGQPVDAVDWVVELGNQLNIGLTQTRKFTMLDRAYDPEVNAELARLNASNVSPSEAMRLNQKLGTDYLVVGEVSFGDVTSPAVNPLTGQLMAQASSLFADIHYRVLLAPTGQLKWSDSVRIDAACFSADDLRSFIAMTAEAAAAEICSGVMNNILPLEVGAINSGMLVIGEGGKQLCVGQRFSVNILGDEVCDTRTGEVIDMVEIPVATAEIVSVLPKMSYARIIEGDISLVKVGARLRPVRTVERDSSSIPATTTIRVNANGGVVAPF